MEAFVSADDLANDGLTEDELELVPLYYRRGRRISVRCRCWYVNMFQDCGWYCGVRHCVFRQTWSEKAIVLSILDRALWLECHGSRVNRRKLYFNRANRMWVDVKGVCVVPRDGHCIWVHVLRRLLFIAPLADIVVDMLLPAPLAPYYRRIGVNPLCRQPVD